MSYSSFWSSSNPKWPKMDYCSFKNTLQRFQSMWLCFTFSLQYQNHKKIKTIHHLLWVELIFQV